MADRHELREYDTTTTGGRVIAGQHADLIDGRAVAYEGDPVFCLQCNKTGRILCDGERVAEFGVNGRKPALSGDLCICNCQPYPRLIASQAHSMSRT